LDIFRDLFLSKSVAAARGKKKGEYHLSLGCKDDILFFVPSKRSRKKRPFTIINMTEAYNKMVDNASRMTTEERRQFLRKCLESRGLQYSMPDFVRRVLAQKDAGLLDSIQQEIWNITDWVHGGEGAR
jgi:hypothetical protein